MATNTSVTATFNEAVQASTITTTNFVLKTSGGSTVTAAVSYNSTTDTATLTPSALLANSTVYTATINNVLSSSGVAMTGPFSWSFTTGPAPAVTSETPISGATGVATSTALTATFNEAVQASTITSSSLVLKSSSGSHGPGRGQLQQLDEYRHPDAIGPAGELDDLHGDGQRGQGHGGRPNGRPVLLVVHHRAGPGGDQLYARHRVRRAWPSRRRSRRRSTRRCSPARSALRS